MFHVWSKYKILYLFRSIVNVFIFCLTTGKIWNCVKEGSKFYKLNKRLLVNVQSKSVLKLQEFHNQFHWAKYALIVKKHSSTYGNQGFINLVA
jgi:hypothetical protein